MSYITTPAPSEAGPALRRKMENSSRPRPCSFSDKFGCRIGRSLQFLAKVYKVPLLASRRIISPSLICDIGPSLAASGVK